MIIKEITIRKMKMMMKNPFTTSFGTFQEKGFLLLEVKDELGNTGGENRLRLKRLGIVRKQHKRIYT